MELQYHIEKITGVRLPVKTDSQDISGNRILVGESSATKKLGLKADNFPSQEYLIRFLPETIVLIGYDEVKTDGFKRDSINYTEVTGSSNSKEKMVNILVATCFIPLIPANPCSAWQVYAFRDRMQNRRG